MCGINGITWKDEKLVAAMNEATKHRGPDATAVWTDGIVTLGANRLAIIDLSRKANQPIQSKGGRFTIVFNGEIYNYRELRRELESAYPFETQGDTEVILALFMRDGVDAFRRLQGMFALAIWDAQERECTLARDHSGIKPLYYREEGGMLSFSSEVKGILADARIPRRMDREALLRYLRLRYVPEPSTIVEGISKLSPASYAVFREGTMRTTRFFEPSLRPLSAMSERGATAYICDLIDTSVSRQLISDRPVGVFLSGGLDSSIVLDAATRAGGSMKTFSLAFELSESEQAEKFNADARIARETARHYGATHHEVILNEEDFMHHLPEAVRFLDQPLANATAVAQYVLAKEARSAIVVALQGDGGDELFGGYPRYRLSMLMDAYQRIPFSKSLSSFSDKLAKLAIPPGIGRVVLFHFEKDALLSRAVQNEFISAAPAKWFAGRYLGGRNASDFTQLLMDVDRRSWLVDEAMARTDTMTMGASLEARVPFLDPDVISFASTLPTSMRVGLSANKRLLRAAFKKRLPAQVLSERKRGFFSPTAKWLRRRKMLALAREVLSSGYHAETDALLHPDILTLLDEHVHGAYAMSTLWTLISLRLYAKEFRMSL